MSTKSGTRSLGIGALTKWWHNWRTGRQRLNELQRCGDAVGHIARDVGLSRSDLYALAAKPPEAADQLKQRLAALDIDRAVVSSSDPMARDLERVCSLCGQKRRCERDLASRPDDPVWRTYCPNTQTLDALRR